MKTLTEINNAEEAVRRRALDYENAKTRVENLQRRVKKLQGQGRDDVKAKLEIILDAAGQLPADVQASLSGLVPLAGEARTFIHALASSALANVRRADEQRVTQLRDAERDLKKAEKALATFTEKGQTS